MFSGSIIHYILHNLLEIPTLICHHYQLLTYDIISADIVIGVLDNIIPADIVIGTLNDMPYQK